MQKTLIPDNCYVGVTATGFKMFVDALSHLSSIKARVKYISLEPLLSWDKVITNSFAYSTELGHSFGIDQLLREAGINWLIIGGKSGKDPFYPPWQWIGEIEDAADKVGIPVFEKYNLRPEWPNLPRQEMPK